jgi:hypothetical protein
MRQRPSTHSGIFQCRLHGGAVVAVKAIAFYDGGFEPFTPENVLERAANIGRTRTGRTRHRNDRMQS